MTQTSPVTVVYSQAPAQSGPASPSIVDLALSQNGKGSAQNGKTDVITSLALGLLSGKKVDRLIDRQIERSRRNSRHPAHRRQMGRVVSFSRRFFRGIRPVDLA